MANCLVVKYGSNPPSGGSKGGCMLPPASLIKHVWKKQVHDKKQIFCLDKGDILNNASNLRPFIDYI